LNGNYDPGEGQPKLTEEILAVGTGGTITNQTVGGLKLATPATPVLDGRKTAPLANQVNTALWAWEKGRWTHYLQDHADTLRFGACTGSGLRSAMTPTEGQLEAFALGADPTMVMYPQLRLQEFCTRENHDVYRSRRRHLWD
jgi:hypothetical protein